MRFLLQTFDILTKSHHPKFKIPVSRAVNIWSATQCSAQAQVNCTLFYPSSGELHSLLPKAGWIAQCSAHAWVNCAVFCPRSGELLASAVCTVVWGRCLVMGLHSLYIILQYPLLIISISIKLCCCFFNHWIYFQIEIEVKLEVKRTKIETGPHDKAGSHK